MGYSNVQCALRLRRDHEIGWEGLEGSGGLESLRSLFPIPPQKKTKMRILCGKFLFGVWVFELEI
jgi:hypothetical protein